MRTLTLSLLMLLSLACVNVAQDVPQPAKEVDNSALLASYLKATGTEKADLRAKLLALSVDDLRAAIAGVAFERADKSGEIVKWYTKCPDGFQRPYWVYVPDGYDPAKRYPLLVCMHGGVSGWPMEAEEGRPSAGEYSIRYWLPNLTDEWKKNVVILGCSAGVPETGEESMWWALKGQKNVLHMISETKRRVNIDDDRVIVNGHSDGGSGTFGFAFRMPDAFAGFYAMNGCPIVPPADGTPVWLENLKGENFQCFNGGKDGLYPAKRMTPIYEQANKLGADIKFTVYPELTHQVDDVLEAEVQAFCKGPLSDWRRDLLPREIDWTCVQAERGTRAWLSIDELGDLGAANKAPANAEITMPAGRPRLGITVERDIAQPTVESVMAGTPAEAMGIEKGDVIKKLDDLEIKTMQDLLDALDTKKPGEDVVIVVERADKERTLKGAFPKAQQQQREEKAALTARVLAMLEEPGRVTLTVRNARKVSIRVSPSMLDADGKLRVRLNPSDDPKEIGIAVSQKFEADKALMLDQFESTGDRNLPWIGRFEIDCGKLLGVKTKPAKPKDEDEF
ncbi:MAG: PDZ domain-containing protein [Planctomycetes bacterium]|nr:PDZ domain-containing protein [Planctomycetota bacterium]